MWSVNQYKYLYSVSRFLPPLFFSYSDVCAMVFLNTAYLHICVLLLFIDSISISGVSPCGNNFHPDRKLTQSYKTYGKKKSPTWVIVKF